MKIIIATAAALFASLNGADARDMALIEIASSGSSYDYIIHVRNTYALGYHPKVQDDRQTMALRSTKGRCRKARIVGEKIISTEFFGITSSFPDYIIMIRLLLFARRSYARTNFDEIEIQHAAHQSGPNHSQRL